ncbi:MAG: hypothetical protein GY795_41250 [Desulfobacterales bacterium]|nr:hypothetical protein [Desulfobacterales bacterium]
MKFIVKPFKENLVEPVVIFENTDFKGKSQELGPGAYAMRQLSIGGKAPCSLKIPDCKLVTLYQDTDFKSEQAKSFYKDAAFLDEDLAGTTLGMVIWLAVTIYEEKNFMGKSHSLILGRYQADDISLEQIGSFKVASGLAVTLFEEEDHRGKRLSFSGYVPDVKEKFPGDFACLMVEKSAAGMKGSVEFNDTVALKAHDNKFMSIHEDGTFAAKNEFIGEKEEVMIVRAGDSKHTAYLNFGDCIALRSRSSNKYISTDINGNLYAGNENLTDAEKFIVWRSGATKHMSLVNGDDIVSLEAFEAKRFITAGKEHVEKEAISDKEKFTLIISEKLDKGEVLF